VIVVDASMLYTTLVDDAADGDRARERLSGETLAAPMLVDLEIVSTLRRGVRDGLVDERRSRDVLTGLSALRLRRARHLPLLPRIWELRDNVTSYDAAYVALAELLDVTLLTTDARLARAPGPRCAVELWA
jgi:predicted nucleic acid-binding protein